MIIAFRTAGPLRAWQLRLAETLEASGHVVRLHPRARRRPARGLAMILAVERRLYGASSALFQPVPSTTLSDHQIGQRVDLVIAFDGQPAGRDPWLEPLFDGAGGEAALIDALMRRRAPLVTIRTGVDGGTLDLATGLPAIEEPAVLSRSLDHVLVRLVTLIGQAVQRLGSAEAPVPANPAAQPAAPAPSPIAFLAAGLRTKLARRFGIRRGRPDHWRILYTKHGDADHALAALPDDGSRFYADPFPFEQEGYSTIFFEDFPYATRKGVIGMVEIGPDGTVSPPRTVLEQPVHLSYPCLQRHDSGIYMLPEMSAARRIQLFRADPFPERWVADRVLVDNVVAGDATPVLHQGRWWMFATLSGDGGSSWDQLGLFHAPDFFGPWTAHAGNPVLIDAGAARPAGALWYEGDQLMRVAQDCSVGYGTGLAICRVDRLDLDGYAQTVIERRGPPEGFGADGIHTLNRDGTLEVCDLRVPHTGRRRAIAP